MENRVKERLIALTRDPSPEVRGAACYALGEVRLKTQEIIDRLIEVSQDHDSEVRAEASKALGRLHRPH